MKLTTTKSCVLHGNVQRVTAYKFINQLQHFWVAPNYFSHMEVNNPIRVAIIQEAKIKQELAYSPIANFFLKLAKATRIFRR